MRKIAAGVLGLFGRALQTIVVGAISVSIIAIPFAIADYSATQGSGTTFASVVVASKHYFANMICDFTVGEAQCVAVNASGGLSVAQQGTWTVQPGNTANTTAWLVTGTGGTFPATQSGSWSNVGVTGTFWPYTLGQQLAAASVPVVLTAAQLSTLTPLSTIAATQSGSWTVAATESGSWTVQPGNTPNTSPWLFTINQGSNSATVKAASTAAVVTDPALVTQNYYEQTLLGTVGTSASCSAGSSSTLIECAYATYAALQNGVGATGSGVPVDAIYAAGNALSSEPTATTTGDLTGAFFDLAGKRVTSPYANRENMVRGYAALSGTSATTIIAASGSSLKTYVTDLTCTRNDAGTAAVTVTLNDSASTEIDIPNNGGGGGYAHTFNVPLVTATNTVFSGTSGASTTTIHCSATGFKGY